MKPRHYRIIGTLSAFTAAGALIFSAGTPALSAEVEAAQDVEILTRGPVHEAFAESVSFEPEPGMIIRGAPPENIEELPPEQQPEGDNVTWIPGYWGWDDDRSDFLWISGIWRNLPPERQWVPGYWDALEGDEYQWTSGYWSDSETTEVAYIPTAPPRSVDVGPNIAAPSEDHIWIPGNWIYGESRYAWRPGYWNPLRPNWTWVPSRHSWTRRGYVYVDGYWDYAVANRGVVFAPVYFNRHVYSQPDYYYTPSIVVSLGVFVDHLFIRPRSGHYYFGDYYAPRYRDSGFYTSFSWHSGGRGYDPIYAYNRWDHRDDRDWARQQEDNYNYFRDNDRFRPPHTWSAMERLRGEKFEDDRGRSRVFANSFDGMVKNPGQNMKFRPVDKERRTELVSQGKEMRKIGQERRKSEARGIVAEDASKKIVTREKIARSPFVGRNADKFSKEDAPPVRPEARGGMMREKRDEKKAEKAEKLTPGDTSPGAERTKPGGDKAPDDNTRGMPDTKPDRKVKPEPTTREKPERKPMVKPDREVKPEPDPREKPERKPMVTPERKVKPEPEPREKPEPKPMVKPERKVKPEPTVREVPKRQVTPERKAKPEPQVRETPKREVQPQREVQPKREVQPQRQVQPKREVQPQKREKDTEKEKKGRPDA